MAIKRVYKNRRRKKSSTLIANPRHRKRNGTRKGGRRKTARKAYKRRRRNPTAMTLAGFPILDVAIGAAAAIALKTLVSNLKFVQDQTVKMGALGNAIVPGLVFGGGWALHQYAKGQLKKIGKYVALTGLIMLIDDVAGAAIKGAVGKVPGLTTSPAVGGAYGYVENPYKLTSAVSGLGGSYLSLDHTGVSGAYVDTPSGTGAFGASRFG